MARQAKTQRTQKRHTCVIVPVSREQHRTLKRYAREHEKSMADVIREEINDLGRKSRRS